MTRAGCGGWGSPTPSLPGGAAAAANTTTTTTPNASQENADAETPPPARAGVADLRLASSGGEASADRDDQV